MSLKRKWLRALFLLMLAGASFGGPMNPKDIEDLLHIMNETKVEFTIPDEGDKGDDGNLPSIEIDSVEPTGTHALGGENAPLTRSLERVEFEFLSQVFQATSRTSFRKLLSAASA